jgi:DNA-binding MarR family transcriptional regulator
VTIGKAGQADHGQLAPVTRPRHDDVALGRALRRAWIGYRRRLDETLAAAGFGDGGFPDGRVLRICSRSPGVTISRIGRELAITRQGAAKIVSGLRDRGYVTLTPSPTDGREKFVTLTPRALDYLSTQRRAARSIERQLRSEIGSRPFDSLHLLLAVLGGDSQLGMKEYVSEATGVRKPSGR